MGVGVAAGPLVRPVVGTPVVIPAGRGGVRGAVSTAAARPDPFPVRAGGATLAGAGTERLDAGPAVGDGTVSVAAGRLPPLPPSGASPPDVVNDSAAEKAEQFVAEPLQALTAKYTR